jgi:hypothetical protein
MRTTLNAVRSALRQASELAPATRSFLTSPACRWSAVAGEVFKATIPADDDGETVEVTVRSLNLSYMSVELATQEGASAGMTISTAI